MESGPLSFLGQVCTIDLVTGQRVLGELVAEESGWWAVEADGKRIWIHSRHVVAIQHGAEGQAVEPPPIKQTSAAATSSPRVSDHDLRSIAEAMLDGEMDKNIAQSHKLKPAVVRTLRRGFEAARGNLVLDDDDPAQTWVARWQGLWS